MSEQLPELFVEILDAARAGKLDPAEDAAEEAEAVERGLWERFGAECAMLVLDSTGFTRTTRERGVVYFLSLFLRMREIVGPIFERNSCLAWRSRADNLFAE